MKYKLLFLVTEDWYFCSHRLSLARAAKNAGYEVVVVTQVSNHADVISAAGFKLVPVIFPRSIRRPWEDIKSLFSILKIYRRERPDIIHHVALKPVVYGSLIAMFAGRGYYPVIINALTGLGFVFTSTNRSVGILRILLKFILRFIFGRKNSHLILQNKDDKRMLIDSGIVRSDQVTLIRGSGVDIDAFKPVEISGNSVTVMLVARMLRDKGVEEFFSAANQLKKQNIQARFVLVGDTDPENPSALSIEKLEQWQSTGIIEWWGKQKNMTEVYKQAQIVVLPSYREGLPMVLLEAAACALPIVATDVPGCREIVIDGENGILVPVKDINALAKAMKDLIISSGLRKQMGEKGRILVEKEFSIDRVITETLNLYKNTLNF